MFGLGDDSSLLRPRRQCPIFEITKSPGGITRSLAFALGLFQILLNSLLQTSILSESQQVIDSMLLKGMFAISAESPSGNRSRPLVKWTLERTP